MDFVMASSEHPEVTKLLHSISNGDEEAVNNLFPLVYNELRGLARRELGVERPGHTLNATSLVHEAYIKLVKSPPTGDWAGRNHFFLVAARAIRQILVNYARNRNALKRGGSQEQLSFDEGIYLSEEQVDDLVGLDEALNILEKRNSRQSKVVECRYFGGYGIEETAEILNISPATVKRDWISARAWLYSQMKL